MEKFNHQKFVNEKLDAIYKEHGVIFAFSPEQLRKYGKEGINYIGVGMGMLIPDTESKEVIFSKITKAIDLAAKIRLEKEGLEKIIFDELNNYETFYTGDLREAFLLLKEHYNATERQVINVYNKYAKNYDY